MPDEAGIFVGGRARRMGGVAKGLLTAPSGETLVARWQRLFGELGVPCFLVGRHEAYAGTDIACIDDDPPLIGPLGGLAALLAHVGQGRAIAVACDMPFVSLELLRRLVSDPSPAPIVAPRRDQLWEPLFARYDAPRVLTAARARALSGEHSLQGLLDSVGAEPLPVNARELEELRDWDWPEDRRIGVVPTE
ncbi:MAG TPA: molybdenum cofactor guanylyltransferase [Polyangiaceae bacterium]|nr:molybdenum cofactor guanylyltransferase [Polyangiaceae bacterium]